MNEEKIKILEKKNTEQGRVSAKMTTDLARCMNDLQKMAYKEEILAISAQLPGLSTKEDIAMVHEMMKSKVDIDHLGVLKTKFEKLEEHQKLFLHEKKF